MLEMEVFFQKLIQNIANSFLDLSSREKFQSILSKISDLEKTEEKNFIWCQSKLEQMDILLDELSNLINNEIKTKNKLFDKKGLKNPQSPPFAGLEDNFWHDQRKFTRRFFWREYVIKKNIRRFVALIYKFRNSCRKLVGKNPIIPVPPWRPAIPNNNNALAINFFADLNNTTDKSQTYHQGHHVSLAQILHSDSRILQQEQIFLSNAPALFSFDESVDSDENLYQAFVAIKAFLDENIEISFANLKSDINNLDSFVVQNLSYHISDKNNLQEIAKQKIWQKVLEILAGKHQHARHPLTNFAQNFWAVSEFGQKTVFHHDIFTPDVRLIAENQRVIFFIDEKSQLICFDPTGLLSDEQKISAKIQKSQQDKDEPIEVHEIIAQDENENTLAAIIKGNFYIYGEKKQQSAYYLMSYLSYNDNVKYLYDDRYHIAFAKMRLRQNELQLEEFKQQKVSDDFKEFCAENSAVYFNCKAGSNRSQLIMMQYCLQRFIENIFDNKDLDQEKFLHELQDYLEENNNLMPVIFFTAIGLQTQCSQFSQFSFAGNASKAFVKSDKQKFSPFIDGIAAIFRFN